MARQTKTIAFSLSEPNAAQENWILDTPKEEDELLTAMPGSFVKSREVVGTSKMDNRQRKRSRRGKTLDKERDEDDMATWLKQCVEVCDAKRLAVFRFSSNYVLCLSLFFQALHSSATEDGQVSHWYRLSNSSQ